MHVVLLEGTKENGVPVTQKERRPSHEKSVFFLKNGLKRKVIIHVDPRKEDRAIRDRIEKSLMYSLSSRIYFEFIQSCDNSYMFNLTNIGLSMCVMEYSDLFLNLI